MPRLRRRTALRREDLENLTDGQRRHLLDGSTYFGDGFRAEQDFRDAWEIHAVKLTDEFNRGYRNDWRIRPFGWWFISGHDRPILNPFFTEKCIGQWRFKQNGARQFGFLHTHCHDGKGGHPFQEPEAAYLARLGLLTDEEREFLEALDVENADDDHAG